MMRKLDLDQETARLPQPGPASLQTRGRRRARDPEEMRALIELSEARWELYIASGQLEIIEPRRWRLHPGENRVREYLRNQKGNDR